MFLKSDSHPVLLSSKQTIDFQMKIHRATIWKNVSDPSRYYIIWMDAENVGSDQNSDNIFLIK
jgi:hypothetical protein